jgi:hypothetical protein
MRWTTERPDKPGWYWIKRTKKEWVVVRVVAKDGQLGVFMDYAGFKKVEYVAQEWAYIPEPTEPQEAGR